MLLPYWLTNHNRSIGDHSHQCYKHWRYRNYSVLHLRGKLSLLFYNSPALHLSFPSPFPFPSFTPAILLLMPDLPTIMAFVAIKFVALACPVSSMFAIIAIWPSGGFMVGESTSKRLTSTSCVLGFHQIHASDSTVFTSPIIWSNQPNLVFLS